MHPRLDELTTYLDARRRALRAAVDATPDALRERRPAPDEWSVAEVVEHLARVEKAIAALIASMVTAARAQGLGAETETSPILATLGEGRFLDRSRRVNSPERAQPTGTMDTAAAWVALEAAREKLREAIRTADGLAIGTLSAPHPVVGPLNLYEWIASVGAHEARHTLQIQEIGARLGGNERSRP